LQETVDYIKPTAHIILFWLYKWIIARGCLIYDVACIKTGG